MTRLKFNDEGKVYNHLKILRQADPKINKAGNKESRVEVECLLCGTLKNMSWSKVKSGWTKTCGCTFFGARKDITGQRFGKLVAVEKSPYNEKWVGSFGNAPVIAGMRQI